MGYQERIKDRYNQLAALKAEYPNIITGITKKDDKGSVSAFIIDLDFVSICFNQFGFFVNRGEDCFYNKYFKTAEEAFDALSLWMHRYGYRFKKYETVKERNGNCYSSVTRETVSG